MAERATVRRGLVVYESMFGNTARIAEAIAGGLDAAGVQVELVDVAHAPPAVGDVDLVVVGGGPVG